MSILDNTGLYTLKEFIDYFKVIKMSKSIDKWLEEMNDPYRINRISEMERKIQSDLNKPIDSFSKKTMRYVLMHYSDLGNGQLDRYLKETGYSQNEVPNKRIMAPNMIWSFFVVISSTLIYTPNEENKGYIVTTKWSYEIPPSWKLNIFPHKKIEPCCQSKDDILSNKNNLFTLEDEQDWKRADELLRLNFYATFRDQSMRELV